MRKIKTSEAIGPVLDWLVAKCEGHDATIYGGVIRVVTSSFGPQLNYAYDWAQGGPIIEREMFSIKRDMCGEWRCDWSVQKFGQEEIENTEFGPTPLIAAMRCYVASKLGDKVEIPEELS